MSANNANADSEGWIQARSKTKSWSIDRKPTKPSRRPDYGPPRNTNRDTNHSNNHNGPKKVLEKVPNAAVDILITEILTLVGDSNWNDPANVSKTIANMMSIDLTQSPESQIPRAVEIDRTVFVPAHKGSDIPHWTCQSFIRVDKNQGTRFIDYKGGKYNKIDIIFENEYFKTQMDTIAKAAHCIWSARWGNAKDEKDRLYQKTRTGEKSDESWLYRCTKHLLVDQNDKINIKNLVMITFKRDLSLLKSQQVEEEDKQIEDDQVDKVIMQIEEENNSSEDEEC